MVGKNLTGKEESTLRWPVVSVLDGNRRIVSTLEFQGGVLPTAGTRTHLHPPPALPGHTGTSVLSVETRSPGASLCNPKHHHKRDGSGCRRGVVKQPHAVPRGLAAGRVQGQEAAGRQAGGTGRCVQQPRGACWEGQA